MFLKKIFMASLGTGLAGLILSACITKYEATGLDKIEGILVVEGIITDDETTIRLSQSSSMTDGFSFANDLNNARVFVECDDGSVFPAEATTGYRGGKYTMKTGKLNLDRKYRLKMEIDEDEYCSDFLFPIVTPEIDSVFWTKTGIGQPVNIYVASHSPDNQVLYYRWSYQEDSDFFTPIELSPYPSHCWITESNKDILLASTEKMVSGRVTEHLTTIWPSDKKLSSKYRMDVKQNAISKKAYHYFNNIKKNSEQSGSIFAPIPSELRGNIICTNDPGRRIIGYMDVSLTVKKRLQILRNDNAYEPPVSYCAILSVDELIKQYGYIPYDWILYYTPPPDPLWPIPATYVRKDCVDCTLEGGLINKPPDWDE